MWQKRNSPEQVIQFFFSSRRRHTRFDCDWSSDVCSSDLGTTSPSGTKAAWMAKYGYSPSSPYWVDVKDLTPPDAIAKAVWAQCQHSTPTAIARSEERRVGKEGRPRGMPCGRRRTRRRASG